MRASIQYERDAAYQASRDKAYTLVAATPSISDAELETALIAGMTRLPSGIARTVAEQAIARVRSNIKNQGAIHG